MRVELRKAGIVELTAKKILDMTSSPELPNPSHCGCETESVPGKLVSVGEALRQGLALVEQVAEVERLSLDHAHGRVLAETARAGSPLPLFDNSAMDGYAIRLADLVGEAPWHLPVAGRVAAGDAAIAAMPAGAALRIFTGAAVPPGCDAVVVQEMAQPEGDGIRAAETGRQYPACRRRPGRWRRASVSGPPHRATRGITAGLRRLWRSRRAPAYPGGVFQHRLRTARTRHPTGVRADLEFQSLPPSGLA